MGYFEQHIDADGNQSELPVVWSPEAALPPPTARITVDIEGAPVHVRAWKYTIRGVTGHEVPVYLLDTQLPENDEWGRTLTDHLYGGDTRYRLGQEIVLGMGGASILRALGLGPDILYHLNEGHSALLALRLLQWRLESSGNLHPSAADLDAVKQRCIFTTHTPVPAGHDVFPAPLVQQVLGAKRGALLEVASCLDHGSLNMTRLAVRFARYVNGVSMKHGEVSRSMFPQFPIHSITNGVHAGTWVSPTFRGLFDRRIPEWRVDNNYLHNAVGIPLDEIWTAHLEAKQTLLAEVARRTGRTLDPKVFTIGFGRRATPYKRPDLIFADPTRLAQIAGAVGPIQLVFGGKAHPHDFGGKELIKRIYHAADTLGDAVRVVYVEGYEMDFAAKMVAGVDLWLNNPTKPLEASGTSGMKAALNGVPNLSVLDGWWIEGHAEGVTGWSIGGAGTAGDQSGDAQEIYRKLEGAILPLYYKSPTAYAEVMRSAIAVNGSFFNTQRMVEQYVRNAYFPAAQRPSSAE